ncbi:MAG: hypothetical protein AAF572_13880 [Cyanobacteria bacterium P01_B01_bin.77]
MGDSQGNPFINNPFMKGVSQKVAQPESEPEPQRRRRSKLSSETSEPLRKLSDLSKDVSKTAPSHSSKKSEKSRAKPAKSPTKTSTKSRSKSKKKDFEQPNPPSTPSVAPGYTGKGYKVQVLAKIPMPTNTNMPSRDYLWFAVYPIIPRVGDCIFHDGRYFRVDAVFLYENTNAGWCADLEVSYYTRRH